jgi:hypothetical protein
MLHQGRMANAFALIAVHVLEPLALTMPGMLRCAAAESHRD